VVSTFTEGDDADQDGYRLKVDDTDSLDLDPTGTAEVVLPPGRHTLRLLGVASPCSVTPPGPVEVDISAGATTPVAFRVGCPATGVRVTVSTTGLDRDQGYRLVVDGGDYGAIIPNHTLLARLDPGNRAIALAELAPNCAVGGSASRVVTVVTAQVAAVEFAVVCTAVTGVIGINLSGTWAGDGFEWTVDDTASYLVYSRFEYLRGVLPGRHVVSFSTPAPCSVQPGPQSVVVTAGSLVRDTVVARFAVTCKTAVRVTAPTSGAVLRRDYSVWLCYDFQDACDWGPTVRLGTLAPNDTLIAALRPGSYELYLKDVPGNCHVDVVGKRSIQIEAGSLRNVIFPVACS
jgi:hypothetical protein